MKNLLRSLFAVLPVVVASIAFAQSPTINQVDAKGRKQGPWERNWAQSSKLRYSGSFKDDKPVGRFTYYSTEGKVESFVDHRPDGKTSFARHFHGNGSVKAEGRYLGKDKDSTWTFFDSFGRKRSTENWRAGQLHGEQLVYYPDGSVADRHHMEKNMLQGHFAQYYPGNRMKYEGNNANGEPEGKVTWYYPNGQKEIEGHLVNGERDGSWYYYHENGSMQIQILYSNGTFIREKKENGSFKTYYENGSLESEITYKNGKREGPYLENHDNGRWVKREVMVGPMEGFQERQTEEVLEGQTKRVTGTYKDDKKHGTWKELNAQGKVLSSVEYLNDEPVRR